MPGQLALAEASDSPATPHLLPVWLAAQWGPVTPGTGVEPGLGPGEDLTE